MFWQVISAYAFASICFQQPKHYFDIITNAEAKGVNSTNIPWLMKRAMYPTKIKKCTFVGKRFFRSERAPTSRNTAIVFGSSVVDAAIQPCFVQKRGENGANCALLGITGQYAPVYSFCCHSNNFQREKQKEQRWRTF